MKYTLKKYEKLSQCTSSIYILEFKSINDIEKLLNSREVITFKGYEGLYTPHPVYSKDQCILNNHELLIVRL